MSKNAESQWIGKRISYVWHPDALTVIIDQSIPARQMRLLTFWLVAWYAVGAAFVHSARVASTEDERMFIMISLAFWLYFAFRVTKVWVWRRIGREMLRVTADGVSVKDAFGNLGRARFYLMGNIKKLEVVRRDPTKFLHSLDMSFWTIGGNMLSFKYLRTSVSFGKQLPEQDALKLARVLDQAFRKF